MRKIDYSGLEKEYLRELGFYDEKYNETYEFKIIKTLWEEICSLHKLLPVPIIDILISDYETLVDFFLKIKTHEEFYTDDEIRYIFDYDKYRNNIANFFIHNTKQLKLYSCCYCDSAYEGDFVDDKGERRTFDVDHFFPQGNYPLFALSLYNFIPCCQVCNRMIKLQKELFEIDDSLSETENRKNLLELSPTSKAFNFTDCVKISYIPKKENGTWHYAPLSQAASERYSVFFDTDKNSPYKRFIDVMLLQERYNSTGIKNQGLYLMDLKKKYPLSKLSQISKKLTEGGYTISPEEIENEIFHKNEKYKLLEKMRNDLLE